MKRIIYSLRAMPLGMLLLMGLCCLVLPPESSASSTGITGRTQVNGVGCSSCHGTNNSSATSLQVTSSSGSFNVLPGSITTFTLAVSHGSHPKAGCNIAVKTTESGNTDVGNLQPASGSGLQKIGNELTHTTPKNLSGGTVQFSFTWQAPTTPGTYYLRAIGNAVNGNSSADAGDNWNWLTPVQITVQEVASITLTSPNGGQAWCPGSSHDITWTSSSIDNVKIELSSDGGNSYPTVLAASVDADAESWTWNIPAGQSVGSMYRVRLSDASAPSVNDASNGNFSIAGAPQITTQPQSQEKCDGQAVPFLVEATGPGLTYQWRRNGQNLSGKTSSSLIIGSVSAADEGAYDVVVNGDCGSPATSQAATLTVNGRPQITAQPVSASICVGEQHTFSVTAQGDGLMYQWRKDGQAINGATASELVISNATLADAGNYSVVVSGLCSPAATSEPVALFVGGQAQITSQSSGTTVCEGESLDLGVEATGGGTLEYRWRRDGQDLPGGNSAVFSIAQVKLSDAGTYDCIVSSACGDPVPTAPIKITVSERVRISQQPAAKTVNEGESATFTVNATGSDLMYQWRKDGTNIDGATQKDLVINAAAQSDQGAYTCIISNSCNEVTSNAANLTVLEQGPGPVIGLSASVLDFESILLGEGKTLDLEITNTGDENLNVTAIEIEGQGFTVEGSLPITIMPSMSASVTLRFAPASAGEYNAALAVTSNARNGNVVATLSGTALNALSQSAAVDFGSVQAQKDKQQELALQAGSAGARVLSAEFSGADAHLFSIVSTLPMNITADGNGMLELRFAPLEVGEFSATLNIAIEGQSDPISVEVNGVGTPTLAVEENGILGEFRIFPNPYSNGNLAIGFTLEKPGAYDVRIVDMHGRPVHSFPATHAPAGTQHLRWDGMDALGKAPAPGMYRIVVRSGPYMLSAPLLIVR